MQEKVLAHHKLAFPPGSNVCCLSEFPRGGVFDLKYYNLSLNTYYVKNNNTFMHLSLSLF